MSLSKERERIATAVLSGFCAVPRASEVHARDLAATAVALADFLIVALNAPFTEAALPPSPAKSADDVVLDTPTEQSAPTADLATLPNPEATVPVTPPPEITPPPEVTPPPAELLNNTSGAV